VTLARTDQPVKGQVPRCHPGRSQAGLSSAAATSASALERLAEPPVKPNAWGRAESAVELFECAPTSATVTAKLLAREHALTERDAIADHREHVADERER
jgi:hypothetical protein